MPWICPACYFDFEQNLWTCSVCGHYPLVLRPTSRLGSAWGEDGCRPVERRRPATTDLATLEKNHVTPRLVRMGYPDLRVPLHTAMAVEGPPGQGKSTLATAVALDVATQGHAVLYLSVEEGVGPTAIHRFKRVRLAMDLAPPQRLLIADVATTEEAHEEIERFRHQHHQGLIVVDSLTDLNASSAMVQNLVADDRFGCIFVLHLTTAGVPRGGLEPLYAVDVWLGVRDLRAHIRKSRWGAGTDFAVLAPAKWDAQAAGDVIQLPRTEEP